MDLRLSKLGHFRFTLIPEKGIVQFLIIDIDLSHFRLNPLSGLLS